MRRGARCPTTDGPERRRPDWAAWTPTGPLAWSGPAGISVLDVDDGRTATIRMPGAGGPEFLFWGVLAPE